MSVHLSRLSPSQSSNFFSIILTINSFSVSVLCLSACHWTSFPAISNRKPANELLGQTADVAVHVWAWRSDWLLQVMESRVRNHSSVGHGQRTGGAAVRGRLASIWPDSLSTALFRNKAKVSRHYSRNITFSIGHESLNCVEFNLWRFLLYKTTLIYICWHNWYL